MHPAYTRVCVIYIPPSLTKRDNSVGSVGILENFSEGILWGLFGFATKAPLVTFGDRLPNRIPTGLAVKFVEENTFELIALLDRDRFSALEAEVENMDPTASLKINKVELNVNNDLRTTVELEVLGVWINNDPVSFGLLTLDRRDEANLIMSNVFSAEVQKKGFARVAKIKVID